MTENNHICSVKDLADLLVCKTENCLQQSICCKYCFTWKHLGTDQKIHQSVKFQASDFYKQILKLFNLQWLISQKIFKSLGSFQITKQVQENMTNYAFYGSKFFAQLFESQQGKNQFFSIRSIYLKQPTQFTSLSQFSVAMLMLDDSTINKQIRKIIESSMQENCINGDLDIYYGVDPTYLQNFIIYQQQAFIKYCEALVNKENQLYSEEGFSIYKYLDWRTKNTQRDPIYHSKQFTNFLLQKYLKNAEEKGLFTLNEYFLNFWHFFSTLVHTDSTVCLYFDQQVKFYKVYEQFMKQNNLFITLHGFRIWKLNNGISTSLTYLKNHFFLQSFIFTYIQSLIQKTYYFQSQQLKKETQDWRDFIQYIKDFTLVAEEKNEIFQMGLYKEYFQYRKEKIQFTKNITQKKDVTLNQEYLVSYLNHCFIKKKLPSLKNYKIHILQQEQKKKQKSQTFVKQADKLKAVLLEQEKQNFYEYIFFNFLNYCNIEQRPLNKEIYFSFKAEVMKNMDERFLKEQEERYVNGEFTNEEIQDVQEKEQMQSKEQTKKQGQKMTQGILNQQINQQEIRIAKQLQQDSSDQDQQMQLCFCCNGDPYNCKNDDCLMMGCCTSCCL